jgi:predicted alpha/beta-hydrolase family hydrolase
MKSAPNLLIDGPRRAERTIILAHGAGARMDTDFMNAFAEGLEVHGLRVVRFEFPYMAAKRDTERPTTRPGARPSGNVASRYRLGEIEVYIHRRQIDGRPDRKSTCR